MKIYSNPINQDKCINFLESLQCQYLAKELIAFLHRKFQFLVISFNLTIFRLPCVPCVLFYSFFISFFLFITEACLIKNRAKNSAFF